MKTHGLFFLLGVCMLCFYVSILAAGCGCDDDDDDDDTSPGDETDDDDTADDDDNDDTTDDDDDADDDDTSDTTPPEFDGLVSAKPGDELVTLAWDAATDPSTPITYNVYLAQATGEQDFGTPVTSTQDLTINVTGLVNCDEYFFVVRAEDAAGNEDGNTVEKSAVPITYECGYTQSTRLSWKYVPVDGPYHVETVGWIEDVNDDGVPDVLAHAFDVILTPDEADTTFCLSGAGSKAGSLIWGAHPTNDHPDYPSDSGGDGDRVVIATPDVTGDGYQDVLVATAWGNRSAYALDGTTGDTIWMFCTYTHPSSPDDGWVLDIKPFPDVTGDGVPEALFGVGSDNESGWLVDGTDGTVLWQTPMTDAVYGVDWIEDVNNDGAPDAILAGGDDEDDVYCVDGDSSGAGTVIWDTTVGNNYALAAIDDVNGDGYQDVLAGSWGADAVVCLSGDDGTEIWTSDVSLFPLRIAPLDDVNDDGKPDLAVTGLSEKKVYVVDGATGTTIWDAGGPAKDYIWAVDRIDDINGDGINDVVSGSFDSYVSAYDGTDGTVLWSWDTGSAKVMTVRGVPDMTDDCIPDVVAGTQCLSQSTPGAGRIFLLNGCP